MAQRKSNEGKEKKMTTGHLRQRGTSHMSKA